MDKMAVSPGIVETTTGLLQGSSTGDGWVFRGVPYAAPVVGEGRFARSVAHEPWQGIRSALNDGPVPPQTEGRLVAVTGDFFRPHDEDCLTLTVWTPKLDGKARPAMIFIHGGAYISGAGSPACYDGGILSSEGDIVVININYRLGALGYLVDPADPFSAALEDQRLAIEWVRANAEAFGIDPDNLTLMGQSAGASSIVHLLQDEGTRKRIKRVILQSGGLGREPLSLDRAFEARKVFLDKLSSGRDLNERQLLSEATIDDILLAQSETIKHFNGDLVFRPLSPENRDRADFSKAVIDALSEIDVIIGGTSEEGKAYVLPTFADEDAARREMNASAGEGTYESYRREFPDRGPRDLLSTFLTDRIFCCGIYRVAQALAKVNPNVYAYLFDWSAPKSQYGACHCIELPFTFGTFGEYDGVMLDGADKAELETLGRDVRRNWIDFIRNGRPAEGWAPVGSEGGPVYRFGVGNRIADQRLIDRWARR